MKAPLVALLALLSAPAIAGQDNHFYCIGLNKSVGKTLFVKPLSETEIRDGEKMPYLVVIRDGSETIFSATVTAELEDVMLSFSSRAGSPKLSGMIYLDEYDQTWMKLGRQEMQFDCRAKEDR